MEDTQYQPDGEEDKVSFESTCGYDDYYDVWFVYEPQVGGTVTIQTDADFDTTLAVYNSRMAKSEEYFPIELACNDDYCSANTNSRVVMDVVKGKTYYIRLAGFDGQMGNYSILVSQGGEGEGYRSDLNGDGVVDWLDFAVFSSEWLMGVD